MHFRYSGTCDLWPPTSFCNHLSFLMRIYGTNAAFYLKMYLGFKVSAFYGRKIQVPLEYISKYKATICFTVEPVFYNLWFQWFSDRWSWNTGQFESKNLNWQIQVINGSDRKTHAGSTRNPPWQTESEIDIYVNIVLRKVLIHYLSLVAIYLACTVLW